MLNKKRHITLLLFTLCTLVAWGEVLYPAEKEIQAGNLSKAAQILDKRLKKNREDVPSLFAYSRLYSSKNQLSSLFLSYRYLGQAWQCYRFAAYKERVVWEKAGFSATLLREEALTLTNKIYEAVLRSENIQACEEFLTSCDLASTEQKRNVQRLRLDLIAEAQSPGAPRHHYRQYAELQRLIRPYVEERNWTKALAVAQSMQSQMKGDSFYEEILRVLSAPEDHTLEVHPLRGIVNTPGDEYVPGLTGDGKTLYFCGRYRTDSIGGEDVYSASLVGGEWMNAAPIEALSTPEHNEAPMSVSTDGNSLFLFMDGRVYQTQRTREGWSTPEPLPSTINFSTWQSDVQLTADGKALLFAAQSRPARDNEQSANLYVSLRDENGHWGRAIDLGPSINTPLGDRSPFLHPDMRTLYFCSEGHGSLGGYDVFRTERLKEDSWTEWSTPVNLGKAINSADKNCWYIISTDGTTAYFTSTVNGHLDIYSITLPEALRPHAVATLSGRVVDENNQPVAITIRWEDLSEGKEVGQTTTQPMDGSYFIALPLGKNYGYYLSDERYFPVSEHIDLCKQEGEVHVERTIHVRSIQSMVETGESIILNNLFFATNEATILPSSLPELQRLARLVMQLSGTIEISGHTDNTGSAAYNMQLSRARAESVRAYLIEAGCAPERLKAVGWGSEHPVADNATEAGKQANRRVEIRVLEH